MATAASIGRAVSTAAALLVGSIKQDYVGRIGRVGANTGSEPAVSNQLLTISAKPVCVNLVASAGPPPIGRTICYGRRGRDSGPLKRVRVPSASPPEEIVTPRELARLPTASRGPHRGRVGETSLAYAARIALS